MRVKLSNIFEVLGFLWSNSPKPLAHVMIVLGVLAGFTRDVVMVVVSKAAAAPLDEALNFWLPLFIVAFLLVVSVTFAYHLVSVAVHTAMSNNVRLTLVGRLMRVQPNFIDRHEHGALYHILTQDVNAVTNFAETLLNLLPSAVFLLIALPQLFYYSSIAGLASLLVMVGGVLAYVMQQKALESLNSDVRRMEVTYFERLSDMLRGFREIRLNQARRFGLAQDISDTLQQMRQSQLNVTRIYSTGEGVVSALKFLLFAGIVFLVPWMASINNTITFQVLTLVLFSLTPFEQIVGSYPSFLYTLVAYSRVNELLTKLDPFTQRPDLPVETPPPFQEIRISNMRAIHNSREKSSFELGPIDFTLRRGEVLFIRGSNGSGKTTFLNVLAGLLDPTEGLLEVDGVPVSTDDMETYRARFSAVFTQFHVFRTLYGLESAPAKDVETIFDKLGLKGLTKVEEHRLSRLDLSAGQRRRLALAIALLEGRQIILLDEFVADQDPEKRKFFFTELIPELVAQGKTIVVSLHDMQWLSACDRILLFEGGRIVSESLPPPKPAPAPPAPPTAAAG